VAHGLTVAAGDERRLAAEAVRTGYRRILAVGGDGTWGNVADALLAEKAGAALGLIAGGTGCDLAKSLGIPGADLAAQARIALAGNRRLIDVGRIEDRHFLNVAGFGYDIAVIEDSWQVRWLRGGALYLYCALRQLWRFPGFPVELEADGAGSGRREMLMLVLANGRVFGGGFRIAPEASLDDGQLDLVAFSNMGPLKRLPLLVRLLRGTHGGAREVTLGRGSSFRLRFGAPPAYETDGEWNQARSAELTVEVVPRALGVLVPS
jgi:diacylglycerol kinase (ATP)